MFITLNVTAPGIDSSTPSRETRRSTERLSPSAAAGDMQVSSVGVTKEAAVGPSAPKEQYIDVESGAKFLPRMRSFCGLAPFAALGRTSKIAGSCVESKYVRIALPCGSDIGSIRTATSTEPVLPPLDGGTVQVTLCPSGQSTPGTHSVPTAQWTSPRTGDLKAVELTS